MSAEASPLPPILAPRFDAIPTELRALPRFVIWAAAPKANGKINKVPRDARSGITCDAHDPQHWNTFDQAKAGYRRFNAAGIGFDLSEDLGIVGIDLDGAVDEQGNVLPWAQDIVDSIDSYTERSPSGRGLRIFCWGGITVAGRNNGNGVEMYCAGRFLTCTGHHLQGTPTCLEARDFEARDLFARLFGDEQDDGDTVIAIDDDEPPVHLDRTGMDFWTGARYTEQPDGKVDRSRTLYAIACHLLRAGATLRATVAALKERDDVLGYLKYRGRPDLPVSDAMRASRALQRERERIPEATTVAAPAGSGANCARCTPIIAELRRQLEDERRFRVQLLAAMSGPEPAEDVQPLPANQRMVRVIADLEHFSARERAGGNAAPDASTLIRLGTIAKRAGVSTDTASKTLVAAERAGQCTIRRTRDRAGLSELWYRSTAPTLSEALATTAQQVRPPDPETGKVKTWGGQRQRCPHCGGERLLVRTICKDCGGIVDEQHLEPDPQDAGWPSTDAPTTDPTPSDQADPQDAVPPSIDATPAEATPQDAAPGSVHTTVPQDAEWPTVDAAAEDWPSVEAAEVADLDAPEDDWSAMLARSDAPAPAVRPLDPAVDRLRAELAEIRRKREGPPPPLLMDDFDRLGVAAS